MEKILNKNIGNINHKDIFVFRPKKIVIALMIKAFKVIRAFQKEDVKFRNLSFLISINSSS